MSSLKSQIIIKGNQDCCKRERDLKKKRNQISLAKIKKESKQIIQSQDMQMELQRKESEIIQNIELHAQNSKNLRNYEVFSETNSQSSQGDVVNISLDSKKDNGVEFEGDEPVSSKKSTRRQAYMNLIRGYIGSGILALPFAFNQVGWILGIIIFSIITVIIYETMNLLFELADSFKREGVDYSYIARHYLGEKGQLIVRIFLLKFQIGCCISYVIFFLKFFESAFDIAGSSNNHDFIYLLIALFIIVPMSFINNVATFSKISFVANIMISITLLAIMSYNLSEIKSLSQKDWSHNFGNMIHLQGTPMMIGVAIYAFEALGLIFSIRNSVERPKENFKAIFFHTNVILFLIYVLFSIIGLFAHGDRLNEIILFNLPKDRIDVHIFQILYALALILSYPLQLLPAFHILESTQLIKQFIFHNISPALQGENQPVLLLVILRRVSVRILISIAICLCAYVVPRFAVFLNIIGAVAGTSLQFILPIIMYLKRYGDSILRMQKIKLYIYFSVGIIGGIFSLIFSLIALFS